jgi:hypothetical protein
LTLQSILAQTDTMIGDQIPSLIIQIIDELRARGVLITNRGGEWCVNVRRGAETTAYLTDDLQDAFEHGRAMVASQMSASAPVKPPEIHRKWRTRMGGRAQRRRIILAHNHRVRARELKKQREEKLP